MGLRVRSLSLVDWRNFDEREVEFSPSMTILHGKNAVGKTNTVEALQLLTAGFSFRKPKLVQLLREGCERARAQARLEGDGRVLDVACDVSRTARRFTRNGKKVSSAEMPQALMSVLFNPDDLSFVKRGASYRRDELDAFGRQANMGYSKVLMAYGRALEQRNRLLKEDYPDLALLDAWDASLALGGATLLLARMRLFERLRRRVCEVYAEIADGEELGCQYVCSLGDEARELGKDALVDLFAERLAALRADELRRQQTLVGPQRDDVAFTIDGRDARTYGSQGQQRSIVLAWKVAEVTIAEEVLGDKPLLLLDDVMSELDGERRAAVTRFVQGGIQTVVTTTNLAYFPDELLAASKVVSYDA